MDIRFLAKYEALIEGQRQRMQERRRRLKAGRSHVWLRHIRNGVLKNDARLLGFGFRRVDAGNLRQLFEALQAAVFVAVF